MSTASRRAGVSGNQRYRGGVVCPICGGSEDDDRGTGSRCYGFIGADGKYAHCSREERAGGISITTNSQTFAHRLKGECKCGIEHGPAEPRIAPTSRPRSNKKPGPIVAEYDYVDEHGELLFQAIKRFPPKSFSQRRPSGVAGTWIYSLGDVRRVLYRLPELLTSDPSQPVFLVEGEKDVDNLRSLGLVATCNPMGAGKWRDDYNDSLKGRTVFIIADNDPDQVGQKHAQNVASRLAGIARQVRWLDLSGPAKALGLGDLPAKGDASDFLAMGGTAEDLVRIFEQAKPENPNVVTDDIKDKRPQIEITTDRYIAIDDAILALQADPDLYSRLGFLVSVAREKEDEAKLTAKSRLRNAAGTPRIIELSESIIGKRLTQYAVFYKWKKDRSGNDESVDIHPPDWLIRSVATHKQWDGIRPLEAVVECPFPRSDGSIVETPGYDAETATLYSPSIEFPPIPRRPSRDDARQAWERIADYFKHFPFASEDDRVVVLAGMLTVIARPAIDGPVPGIAVIGNKAGTGKGLLIDGMSMPAIGRPAPTSAYPEDKEEAVKVKVAIAMAARSVVHFDNLDEGSMYGNGALDSALTALTVDDRVLGASKLVGELRLRASWFLSGNNINPCKDAYRRWLVCNLVTELEHPERRDDLGEKSFRSIMNANRGTIVRDALTILRAHSLADRPGPDWGPLGSFEEWDRTVRRAVWFATDRDCLATQRATAEGSQDRQDKLALLQGWLELPGGNTGLTTNEAVEHVEKSPGLYPTLHGVMIRLGQAGKPMTARAMGNRFRGLKNNRIDGLMMREAGERHKTTLWAVDSSPSKESGQRGNTGSGGCSPNTNAEVFQSDSDIITNAIKCKPYRDTIQRHPPDPQIPLLFDPDDPINAPGFDLPY